MPGQGSSTPLTFFPVYLGDEHLKRLSSLQTGGRKLPCVCPCVPSSVLGMETYEDSCISVRTVGMAGETCLSFLSEEV